MQVRDGSTKPFLYGRVRDERLIALTPPARLISA